MLIKNHRLVIRMDIKDVRKKTKEKTKRRIREIIVETENESKNNDMEIISILQKFVEKLDKEFGIYYRCSRCGKPADGFIKKDPRCQSCLYEDNFFKDYDC